MLVIPSACCFKCAVCPCGFGKLTQARLKRCLPLFRILAGGRARITRFKTANVETFNLGLPQVMEAWRLDMERLRLQEGMQEGTNPDLPAGQAGSVKAMSVVGDHQSGPQCQTVTAPVANNMHAPGHASHPKPTMPSITALAAAAGSVVSGPLCLFIYLPVRPCTYMSDHKLAVA